MTTPRPEPEAYRYRVTAPMRSPRYFQARSSADDYARHTPGAVTHRRDIHPNGATGPWLDIEGTS